MQNRATATGDKSDILQKYELLDRVDPRNKIVRAGNYEMCLLHDDTGNIFSNWMFVKKSKLLKNINVPFGYTILFAIRQG
jgi:hypothetical protein